MGLRILITNFELGAPTGTTLYVRDVALELRRKGHEPIVFAKYLGSIAADIERAHIGVTRRLRDIRPAPDIIHGHHWIPTLAALRHFRGVPAIYICHDHTAFVDGAVLHPQIRRYFGVSLLCIDRLIREGVPPERIRLLHNFVDTQRFVGRAALPLRPRRALVFSNYAHAGTHLPAVTEACRNAGLELDVLGQSSGHFSAQPELLLPLYDIVFAKAKAAIEAMATGASVILCDYGGVGPIVTRDNFDYLRSMNFGFQTLTHPLAADALARQIERYDPNEAAVVCAMARSSASLAGAVEDLCEIYRTAIEDKPPAAIQANARLGRRRSRFSRFLFLFWLKVPSRARVLLKRLPGITTLISGFWKWTSKMEMPRGLD